MQGRGGAAEMSRIIISLQVYILPLPTGRGRGRVFRGRVFPLQGQGAADILVDALTLYGPHVEDESYNDEGKCEEQ